MFKTFVSLRFGHASYNGNCAYANGFYFSGCPVSGHTKEF